MFIFINQGFCKVLNVTTKELSTDIFLSEFKYPQPDGFALKTSIEINNLENKFTFVNNLPIEKKEPIGYTLDNAVLVTIKISLNDGTYLLIRKFYSY